MKRVVIKIHDFCNFVGRFSGKLSALILVVLVVMILWEVFTRSILHDPAVWVEPFTIYGLVALSFVSAANTMNKNMHVSVDIVVRRLKPRNQLVFQIFTHLIALAYTVVLMVLGTQSAYQAYQMGSKDITVMLTPLYIPYAFVPIGLLLLALVIIGKIMENIMILKGWQKQR